MRLRSDIFVAALLRRAQTEGAFAALRRRGAAEAGAIFVVIDALDGRKALYGPAPSGEEPPPGVARLFARRHEPEWTDALAIEEKLQRELKFDSDLWIVEIEDRLGRVFVDVA